MRTTNTLGSAILSSLLSIVFATPSLKAQDPSSVDIDLRLSTQNTNELEVYLRANDQSLEDIISGLTFTIRWVTTSPATLGIRENACPEPINIGATPMEVNPLIDDIPTGYNYRTYNAFGLELLSDWGCTLNADEWHLVMTVPVENNTGCTEFNIVNDAWTNAPGNARDYFLSLGGLDHTGVIEPTPVLVGDCTSPDCEGVPGGTALPGTPCDDGNTETENDTWNAECVCVGETSTGLITTDVAPGPVFWPNPTTGQLNYSAPAGAHGVRLRVTDVLGRVLTTPITRNASASAGVIDLSGAPSGMYLVEIELSGERSVHRVVKR